MLLFLLLIVLLLLLLLLLCLIGSVVSAGRRYRLQVLQTGALGSLVDHLVFAVLCYCVLLLFVVCG